MYDIVSGPFVGRGGIRRRRSMRRSRRDARMTRREGRNSGAPVTEGSDLLQSSQRVQHFGLGAGNAATSGAILTLSQVAQKPMQPIGFVVASDDIDSIVVDDLKIGTVSQLAGVGSLPARLFNSDGTQNGATFTPAGPGVTISLLVHNIDESATHRVSAGLRVVAANAA